MAIHPKSSYPLTRMLMVGLGASAAEARKELEEQIIKLPAETQTNLLLSAREWEANCERTATETLRKVLGDQPLQLAVEAVEAAQFPARTQEIHRMQERKKRLRKKAKPDNSGEKSTHKHA